jgi:hypothetical protein
MRKLTFIVFVALGVVVGLVSAAKDDWATRAVMMGIGALFGAGVGGGLTRLGSRAVRREPAGLEAAHGQGAPEDDLVRNYWRDRGHAPFMKPSDAPPDKHMFDADKLN